MTIPNIGNLYVKKEGDCAKFTWQITWLSRKGDLPEATVSTVLIQQAVGLLQNLKKDLLICTVLSKQALWYFKEYKRIE